MAIQISSFIFSFYDDMYDNSFTYNIMDPKQVIIMRKDLNMRKGKMIAQGAHASMKVFFDMMNPKYGLHTVKNGNAYEYSLRLLKGGLGEFMNEWIQGIFKKIVVGAESLSEVVAAYEEAKRQGIPCAIIHDAGLTEFGGENTITCAAIGPDDPGKIDKITGHLSLL